MQNQPNTPDYSAIMEYLAAGECFISLRVLSSAHPDWPFAILRGNLYRVQHGPFDWIVEQGATGGKVLFKVEQVLNVAEIKEGFYYVEVLI